jgi:hypothetical protein
MRLISDGRRKPNEEKSCRDKKRRQGQPSHENNERAVLEQAPRSATARTQSGDKGDNNANEIEKAIAKWTKRLAIFTGGLAFFTLIAAAASIYQSIILSGQLAEMQGAATDMKTSIEATNRLAKAAENYTSEAKRLADIGMQSRDIANSAMQSSRAALERSQRAWIAPIDAEIDPNTPLVLGATKISFRVVFQNTGKEPALDLTVNQQSGASHVPVGFSDWDKLSIPKNITCDDLTPVQGNMTVYPSGASQPYYLYYNGIPDKDAETSIREILTGVLVVWVNGCLVYRTIDTSHQSASLPRFSSNSAK